MPIRVLINVTCVVQKDAIITTMPLLLRCLMLPYLLLSLRSYVEKAIQTFIENIAKL
jgi:hypothetical protein